MLSLAKRLAAALHRQRVRRIAVNELSALGDLALTDIEIDRSQIRLVVEKLLESSESAEIRPKSDTETQATPTNLRMPYAFDRERRLAA